MSTTKFLIAITTLVFFVGGCIFDDSCEIIGGMDFSENEYPASFISLSDTFNVGESFTVELSLPRIMKDTSGVEHTIVSSPDIWIRFTDQETVVTFDPDTVSVFYVGGETLHATFDEHFQREIKIGTTDSKWIWSNKAELIDNEYKMEVEYTFKQKGIYLMDIGYNENDMMVEDDLGIDCINFRQPKVYWKENSINQVLEYYSDEFDQSTRFVFEVN